MRMIGAFALALVVFGQSFSTAQSTAFVGLGHLGTTDFHVLQSSAHAVSRDGSVVVGGSTSAATDGDGREAFRWTRQTGMVGLGDLPGGNSESFAYAVSGDGASAWPTSCTPMACRKRAWTPSKPTRNWASRPTGEITASARRSSWTSASASCAS